MSKRIFLILIVALCFPLTYFLEQDFLYWGRILLWFVRFLILFGLIREIRLILLSLINKSAVYELPYHYGLAYIGLITIFLIGTIAASSDLIFLRDQLHYNQHEDDFQAVLSLARTSECYSSNEDCQENVRVVDNSLVDWIWVVSSHQRKFVTLSSENNLYSMVYIENQDVTSHSVSIWHWTYYCYYHLGDNWFLCG